MPSAHVQTVLVDTTGTSVAFPAITVSAGDLITVCVRYGSQATHGVSDSLGNNYTNIYDHLDSGLGYLTMWYAKNITGGSCTVTVTVGTSTTVRGHASEWSGVDTVAPLDVNTTPFDGTGTNSTTSNSGTTVQAAEMLIGFVVNNSAVSPYTAGTVGTATGTIPTNGSTTKSAIEYHNETATGSYTAAISWNVADNQNSIALTSFKDAGAAAPTVSAGQEIGRWWHPGQNPVSLARFAPSLQQFGPLAPAPSVLFRKTLSSIGTHTGGRETHNTD